ncbi:CheY chemotaxis protein or a CheY-like REC (receiver) domain [Dyadobacter koreensis]|uniref:CheY chemotaxis protein or a CheY-like REC (Receiver) domain n=1 Tax=Dyadobacter koreensis TaxID=408657 RepID=A0A1H6TCP6_9BACT|nr:response regulator [Dyadobacter koreensis]SEI74070.1 CheY chemotaxis protein or a CheY-like REC (receiver) domain [Dyadobacter koreensis]
MKSIHILLVEDNEGDILLTTEALLEGKTVNKVSVVRDGEQALDFLNQKRKFVSADAPDLILLDVNLPRKNGHEVLHYIKTNEKLKHIPVIMLTTSSSDTDINKSYSNHANCYITKPVESESFLNVVSTIENFWINVVKLPSAK